MARILVVDDEKDTVGLLRYMLTREGYQVSEATDGDEALRAVGIEPRTGNADDSRELPDLIILDVMMPRLDGYTVYSRLQSNARTREIPVLILTAKGKMWELFENAAAISAFLEKPFDPKFLLQHIREALARRGKG